MKQRDFGLRCDHEIEFTLDFQAKDGRARFQFEDLQMVRGATAFEFAYGQLGDASKVGQIKPCLRELAETMVKAGVEREKAENW